MSCRIEGAFALLRRRREKALIGYLTVGFPTLKALPGLVAACVEGGMDLLELGVPFSDPLADGPTIQAASQKALAQGVTPARVLSEVRGLRRRGVKLPIILMTYYNPVLRFGIERFCREAAASGVDGLIVPDLPPEEAAELRSSAEPAGLAVIFLAAPTSSRERLKRIVRSSSGFVYYVSLTGVTGARRRLPKEVRGQVRAIRRMTRLPVCVGFGVSRPEQVKELAGFADGVIVGSALLDRIGGSGRDAAAKVRDFVRRLKRACR